jgi:type I restriction enzyme R subunit
MTLHLVLDSGSEIGFGIVLELPQLIALHGPNIPARLLDDLCKWMDTYGALHTLRHGFKCYGRTLRIAFFKAAHELNPDLEARYAANILGVTRQLRYNNPATASSNTKRESLKR